MANWTKLYNVKTNPKDSNHQFLHGIIPGKEEYHGIVIDKAKRKAFWNLIPLKDIIFGKSTDCVVDKIKTEDPEIALAFFKKYNN